MCRFLNQRYIALLSFTIIFLSLAALGYGHLMRGWFVGNHIGYGIYITEFFVCTLAFFLLFLNVKNLKENNSESSTIKQQDTKFPGPQFIAFCFLFYWFLTLSNRYGDYRDPTEVIGVVVDKDSKVYRNLKSRRKMGKSYLLSIKVDERVQKFHVTSSEYNNSYVNQSVRLTIRHGLWGFQWVDRIEPSTPGDRPAQLPKAPRTLYAPKTVDLNANTKKEKCKTQTYINGVYHESDDCDGKGGEPLANGKKCFSMQIIDGEMVTSDKCPKDEE